MKRETKSNRRTRRTGKREERAIKEVINEVPVSGARRKAHIPTLTLADRVLRRHMNMGRGKPGRKPEIIPEGEEVILHLMEEMIEHGNPLKRHDVIDAV